MLEKAQTAPCAPSEVSARELTMSSLEISALMGVPHERVLANAHMMLTEYKLSPEKYFSSYVDDVGEARDCFHFSYHESIALAGTFFPDPRAALVLERWEQLRPADASYNAMNDVEFLKGIDPVIKKDIEDSVSELRLICRDLFKEMSEGEQQWMEIRIVDYFLRAAKWRATIA